MIILGITHPISWNTASCLLVDGKLVAMAEEERFTRIKHAPRAIPLQSIDYCLKKAGLSLVDVDYISVGWEHPNIICRDLFYDWVSNLVKFTKQNRSLKGILYDYFFYSQLTKKVSKAFHNKKILFVNHHLAHAASSFFTSGFDKAAIISIDGSGGDKSGILAIGENNSIKVIKSLGLRSSWGAFYEEITHKLGFKRHSGEGKVMGLAAYGKPNLSTFNFIDFNKELAEFNWEKMLKFVRALKTRNSNEQITQEHKNLAATLQAALEKAVIMMCEYLKKNTGLDKLCLCGGVSLNCSMNGKIAQTHIFKNIFIQPASHDSGSALGAAILCYIEKTGKRPDIRMNNAYFGPEYSNEEIITAIESNNITKFKFFEDICAETAKLLAQGKIIGWMQGRMEIGPRALGARSILANPSLTWMRDKVNNEIKHREPWRPFAPSILSEYIDTYIEDPYNSPFMLIAFNAKKDTINNIISASHVDGTVRVQCVNKNESPLYWELIEKFRQETGIPALLNTSFNDKDEPVVCSPQDAIKTFNSCGLDYLVMGNFLISK